MTFEQDCQEWYDITRNEVFGHSYGAFGDAFSMVSYTILCARKFGSMKLNVKPGGKRSMNYLRVLPLLEDDNLVEHTLEEPTVFTKLFCTRKHREKYVSTKIKWEGNPSGPICYHYDKMTFDKRSERFPDRKSVV